MKQIIDITITDIKATIVAKGYRIFTENGVPNIVGVRNVIRSSNSYDDRVFVWWTENGIEVFHDYTMTTHPGLYYLKNLLNPKGCAILSEGQHLNCWHLAMHRQQQLALCQCGVIKVYRDGNKDDILDYDIKTLDAGDEFGIDLHHAGVADSPVIDKYSAGCQVWRYHQPHMDLMDKFTQLSHANNYHLFSYTLLKQEEI